jgi:hypothetical protein
MSPRLLGLLLGLAGCQEYVIDGWQRAGAVPNAPTLNTPYKTDTIVQTTPSEVDVLFVLDDSGSMREEQEKLARNLPVFLDYFLDSGLSWHIGVTTTDVDGDAPGELRSAAGYHLITQSTPEAGRLFEHMVRVGVGGSGDEKGLFATFLALAKPAPQLLDTNRGLNRPDAALHVIVVSDEEDSSGYDQDPYELADYLDSTKSDPEIPVTFNSIVGPGPAGCRNDETNAAWGSRYQEVTDTVGGLFWSICQQDWAPILDALGAQASQIRKEFFLSEVPVPGTLTVRVKDRGKLWLGEDVDDPPAPEDACVASESRGCFTYRYDDKRNSVFFLDYIPTPQAEVRLTYALLSGAQGDLLDDTDPPE